MTAPKLPPKTPKPTPAAKKLTVPKTPVPKNAEQQHKAKSFSLAEWTNEGQGQKLVIYGKSGIGKTTLAAQLQNAVFIGLDDGGRHIHNPLTNKPVKAISGITSFLDLRDALGQNGLFPDDCTIVVDTFTKCQELIEAHVVEHVAKEKGGNAKNLNDFGWGDGFRHVYEHARLILSDLDAHIQAGRNVILLCQLDQITVANSAGADFLEDGPKLQQNRKGSIRTEVCEWADHVCRIGYLDFQVLKGESQKTGKVASQDETRAVFTGGAPHFIAKSRPINGYRIPPIISFDGPEDNALWQFLFEGAQLAE